MFSVEFYSLSHCCSIWCIKKLSFLRKIQLALNSTNTCFLSEHALSGCADIDVEPAGHHSFLSFEQSDSIIGLPVHKYDQKRVTATASWDSSVHDSVYLNRVTQNTERVYVILKVSYAQCKFVVFRIVPKTVKTWDDVEKETTETEV